MKNVVVNSETSYTNNQRAEIRTTVDQPIITDGGVQLSVSKKNSLLVSNISPHTTLPYKNNNENQT